MHASLRRVLSIGLGGLMAGLLLLILAMSGTWLVPDEQAHAAPLAQTLPEVSFNSANINVTEDNTTVEVEVIIDSSPAASEPVTVTYFTLNGTATASSDYFSTSGILTFSSTSGTSTSFDVTIREDSISETSETINLVLSSPENATLDRDTATITILDDDPTPTATGDEVIFIDEYEPNDSIDTAYQTASDAGKLCEITFWPVGDVDYFTFFAKEDSLYRIETSDLEAGLDTVLRVFDPSGKVVANNDDYETGGNRASRVTITAKDDGFYYAEIVNRNPTNPTGLEYCFQVTELDPPTPTPSNTPVPGADDCEFNSTIEFACTIGVGQTVSLSFVPVFGSLQDTDYLRLWVKPGILYTCETLNLSPVTDTNIIFLDNNGNDFQPNLGNDDRAPGDLSSRLSYLSTYTGWLHIVIGPVNPPPFEESSQHTYDVLCTSTANTPTPTASATRVPGTGGVFVPTSTPFVFPTFPPTPTPFDVSQLLQTPTPLPPPDIQFQPLPTPPPPTNQQQDVNIGVTLYYDTNNSFTPELTEGIVDVAVALYDNATGNLLSFGYTNEAGMVRFDSVMASGALRLEVPYLNYSQVILNTTADVLLRVAPQPLPIGIP